METFYIITNYSKDENYEVTRQIQDYIEKRGRTCILCERDEEGNLLTDQIPKETDCVLTLGGDGTLIQAVRELRNKHLPLIGVNMGTLGYLTEIELPKIEESLEKLFCGAFLPERRMMLQGRYRAQRYCCGACRKYPCDPFQYLCQWTAFKFLPGRWSDHLDADRLYRVQPVSGRTDRGTDGRDVCDHTDLFTRFKYKQYRTFGGRRDRDRDRKRKRRYG